MDLAFSILAVALAISTLGPVECAPSSFQRRADNDLVRNGGFEQDAHGDCPWTSITPPHWGNWIGNYIVKGCTGSTFVYNGCSNCDGMGMLKYEGDYFIQLHGDCQITAKGPFNQEIDGIVDGQTYDISFTAAARPRSGNSFLFVKIDGETVFTTNVLPDDNTWRQYSFVYTAASNEGSINLGFSHCRGGRDGVRCILTDGTDVSDNVGWGSSPFIDDVHVFGRASDSEDEVAVTEAAEMNWELGANINPCDGQDFGYGGPWSMNKNVGSSSHEFTNDYLNNDVWKKPLGYITICRHVKGNCTMSKTWKLLDDTKSLYDYFSTYPGRMLVTGDGSKNDNHISSDIPNFAEGLSGDWKDPIFGADGGLAFNWYYSNNGARIAVPGGYKIPYNLPSAGENNDDLHGLGNEFGATTSTGMGSGEWRHDAAKIGPDCHGGSCQMVGTDHGSHLNDGECWGSYAVYVSKESRTFTCQGKYLSTAMTTEHGRK